MASTHARTHTHARTSARTDTPNTHTHTYTHMHAQKAPETPESPRNGAQLREHASECFGKG
eukprot:8653057-Alexandrium_andersonii.AAC.1